MQWSRSGRDRGKTRYASLNRERGPGALPTKQKHHRRRENGEVVRRFDHERLGAMFHATGAPNDAARALGDDGQQISLPLPDPPVGRYISPTQTWAGLRFPLSFDRVDGVLAVATLVG